MDQKVEKKTQPCATCGKQTSEYYIDMKQFICDDCLPEGVVRVKANRQIKRAQKRRDNKTKKLW
jgi:hypothetical protein